MEIVVLIWQAMVGGEAQMIAAQQPNMELCAQRLEALMTYDSIPGEKIGEQQTWLEIKDKKGKCVRMTEAQLFALGDVD